MGAAAGKQFQSDKAKHAGAILEAVQAYENAHPGELPSDNFSFQPHLFKKRVLLAVEEAKKKGKDCSKSLQQLSDADLETLFHYIETNRHSALRAKPDAHDSDTAELIASEQRERKGNPRNLQVNAESLSSPDRSPMHTFSSMNGSIPQHGDTQQSAISDALLNKSAMAIEEFGDDENNNDETTSVLSYGDDRDESENEHESSGSFVREKGRQKNVDKVDVLEDLEIEERGQPQGGKRSTDSRSKAAVIFPSDASPIKAQKTSAKSAQQPLSASKAALTSGKGGQFETATKQEKSSNKDQMIKKALSKFWEVDEELESPVGSSPFNSPFASSKTAAQNNERGKRDYKERGQNIDERNERLIGLQRQKVMSYTQNAQLEREVEALQKQLEMMEELEKSMDSFYNTMASSAVTVDSDSHQTPARKGTQGSYYPFPSHSRPSMSINQIYPIDEEAIDIISGKERSHQPAQKSLARPVIASKKANMSNSISDSDDDQQENNSRDAKNNIKNMPSGLARQLERDSKERDVDSDVERPRIVRHVARRRHRSTSQSVASGGMESDDSSRNDKDKQAVQLVNISDSEDNSRMKNNAVIGNNALGLLKRQVSDKFKERQLPNASVGGNDGSVSPTKAVVRRTRNSMADEDSNSKDGRKEKASHRRYSLDGAPSTVAENVEKAISALSEVEKLLSPDRLLEGRDHSVDQSGRPKPRRRRQDMSTDSIDSTPAAKGSASPRPVLNDGEFQALFAENKAEVREKLPKKRNLRADALRKQHSVDSVQSNNAAWSSSLDQQWAEVSLLLRKPIKSEEDMFYAVASAEAGILFTDQMNTIAKHLNVLRGQLSRWILPFDSNTRIESQCSTPHSVVENMPEEFRGKISERQVHYLVTGANGVRKLVRIKIADDNDLEQARSALQTTDLFFKELYERARQYGTTPFELLKSGNVM